MFFRQSCGDTCQLLHVVCEKNQNWNEYDSNRDKRLSSGVSIYENHVNAKPQTTLFFSKFMEYGVQPGLHSPSFFFHGKLGQNFTDLDSSKRSGNIPWIGGRGRRRGCDQFSTRSVIAKRTAWIRVLGPASQQRRDDGIVDIGTRTL